MDDTEGDYSAEFLVRLTKLAAAELWSYAEDVYSTETDE